MDKVAETLCEAFKGAQSRKIVRFGGDRRPDVTNLGNLDIVVATSALQTGKHTVAEVNILIAFTAGTNMSPFNLVFLYGMAHSVENLLQGGGRAARDPNTQVW